MAHPKKFNLYIDPNHAWLRVPLSELRRLSLLSKISSDSFIKNEWVYLEEDQDAALYLERLKQDGFDPFDTWGCVNEIVSLFPSHMYCFVHNRNYQRFDYIDIAYPEISGEVI